MKRKALAILLISCIVGTMTIGCGSAPVSDSGNAAEVTQETEEISEPETAPEPVQEDTSDEAEDTEIPSSTAETEEAEPKQQETTAEIAPAENMSDAPDLPLNTKVRNEIYSGQTQWYTFTTGEESGVDYGVIFVNTTSADEPGDHTVEGMVRNEFGEEVGGGYHFVDAGESAETITIERAEPNTTYYIGVKLESFRKDSGYTLVVKEK